MNTKLEDLVEFLRAEGEDEEIINKLIIDNYNDQDSKEYIVGTTTYEVLSFRERDDEVVDMAEYLADDDIRLLTNLINSQSRTSRLAEIIPAINREEYIETMIENISEEEYQEHYSCEQASIGNDYIIYKLL